MHSKRSRLAITRVALLLAAGIPLLGCPDVTPTPAGGKDAGATEPPAAPFALEVLDEAARGLEPLAMAVLGDTLGIAYFTAGAASGEYDLRYLQWEGGEVTARALVKTLHHSAGVSVAFGPDGRPAIAHLGGGADDSQFWKESDAVIAWGQGDGSWQEEIVVRESNEAPAGNPTSDTGVVVGLFPALAFQGATAHLAYRDVHGGQYKMQDWAPSDVEIATGTQGSWERRVAMNGNTDQGYGGHLQMVLADGQPALVSDQVLESALGPGQNVIFSRRLSTGAWTQPLAVLNVGNAQSGPSLAHDGTLGFGIAVVDRNENALSFVSSADGATWTVKDPVFQSGTGGWWPSLAIDAATHEPSIAFYVCGLSSGLNEGNCPASEDSLRVTRRIEGRWREVLVDPEGGYLPQLAHLSDGRRVIAYRDPGTGALKLAVER